VEDKSLSLKNSQLNLSNNSYKQCGVKKWGLQRGGFGFRFRQRALDAIVTIRKLNTQKCLISHANYPAE
jgi:hypothetical protein